jgi:hypothetical protein
VSCPTQGMGLCRQRILLPPRVKSYKNDSNKHSPQQTQPDVCPRNGSGPSAHSPQSGGQPAHPSLLVVRLFIDTQKQISGPALCPYSGSRRDGHQPVQCNLSTRWSTRARSTRRPRGARCPRRCRARARRRCPCLPEEEKFTHMALLPAGGREQSLKRGENTK